MEFQLAFLRREPNVTIQLQPFAIERNFFDYSFRQIIMDKIPRRYRHDSFYTSEEHFAVSSLPGRILAAPIAFSAGRVRPVQSLPPLGVRRLAGSDALW